MKIFFRIIFISVILISLHSKAQDGSPSPYSFFGLGDTTFNGTTENIAMGGLRIYADSIHYNINNPAALTRLKYVNLNIGISNKFLNMSDQTGNHWASAHNISYFGLGLPVGKKIGIGLGLIPVSSGNYKIFIKDSLGTYTFEGKGGNSRIFITTAYQITKNLSFGVEYQYYFGYLNHENFWIPTDPYTYTKENSDIDFSGQSFKFSGLFRYPLKEQQYINVSAGYSTASSFKAHYKNFTQLITSTPAGNDIAEELSRADKNDFIKFPANFYTGLGYGKENAWFLGLEYNQKLMQDFRNPFFDPAYVQYQTATTLSLGGFYTPQYNSVVKYWKRATYRAGAYYKNTGLIIYNTPITDFGITFGVSLPALRGLSNLNLGFEVGQRGKNTGNLVQEQYINFHIGLSLNDRWFIKRKIN